MADQQTLQQRIANLEQILAEYCNLSKQVPLDEQTQRQVAKIEQMADKLRGYLKNEADLAPEQPKSNIKQDPEEVAEAQTTIDTFATTETPEDVFLEITKGEFVYALKQRIADPTGVDQSQLNLCGAASFMVLWIERDPRGFAKAAIELFQTGKSTYKEVKIKANKSMFGKTEFEPKKYNLQLIDWMMLSSLQNASGLLGYSPTKEMGGIRGIGLPGKVLKWFEKLSGGEVKKYRKDLKPSALNKLYREDHYILFLINVNRLYDYFTEIKMNNPKSGISKKMSNFFNGITGNHYVVLNSPIRKEGEELVFDLWTWANSLEVRIPGRIFKKTVVQTFVVEPEKEGEDEY
ncbi:MAG: hypothetical protein ACRBFS_22435 [Aureispira sp.]